MKYPSTLLLVMLAMTLLCQKTVTAQSTPMVKLHARNTLPQIEPGLGFAAAMNDKWIVMGEPGNDDQKLNAGAVHVYEAATGKWLRKLSNPEPEVGALFGYSVAVSGDLCLIGAPLADVAGLACLFDLKTGALIRTLRFGGAVQKYFGWSVALEGRRAAVGAPEDVKIFLLVSKKTGSVKVYEDVVASDTASLTLYPADAATGDYWGHSLCMDGGLLLGGAPTHNSNKGAGYVFDAKTGEELITIEASDTYRAGTTVALAGGIAYVGAPGSDTSLGSESGLILKTVIAGQNQYSPNIEKLLPAQAGGGKMGYSIAAWGSSMIAGAPFHKSQVGGVDSGRADVFSFHGLKPAQSPKRSLYAKDTQMGDGFGHTVCLWGNRVLMTAVGDDDLGGDAGAAYLITSSPHSMDFPVLAQTGSHAPGLVDARFSVLGEAYCAQGSFTASFTSKLVGAGLTGGAGSAVFSTNTNDFVPSLSLASGKDLQGLGLPGVKIASFSSLSANKENLYQAKLIGTGVTTANDGLLLNDNGISVSPLYREGNTVANLGGAVVSTWSNLLLPPSGPILMVAQFKPGSAGITAANDTALLKIDGPNMATGGLMEGSFSAAVGVNLGTITRVDAADTLACVVHTTLQAPVATNTALLHVDTTNMTQTLVARKGGDAPGVMNGKFSNFIAESITGANLIFRANVAGTGITAANNEGIWKSEGGMNELLLRTGSPVGGLSTSIVWSKILGVWPHEDKGLMVYGQIRGTGVAAANDTILWLLQENGGQTVLLREGDLVGGSTAYRLGAIQRVAFAAGGSYMVLARLLGAPADSDTVLLSGETYYSYLDKAILRRPVMRMREGTLYDRQEGVVSKLSTITWSGPAFDVLQRAAQPRPLGLFGAFQLGYSSGAKELIWGVP
jgi:FG-GAP repeat